MPATVGDHGPDGGWLVLDDGTRLSYAPGAVDPLLRLLRSGQRVHVRLAGEPPEVVALALAGMAP